MARNSRRRTPRGYSTNGTLRRDWNYVPYSRSHRYKYTPVNAREMGPVYRNPYVTNISRRILKPVYSVVSPFTHPKKIDLRSRIINKVAPIVDICKKRNERKQVILASGKGGKGFRIPRWTWKSFVRCK